VVAEKRRGRKTASICSSGKILLVSKEGKENKNLKRGGKRIPSRNSPNASVAKRAGSEERKKTS